MENNDMDVENPLNWRFKGTSDMLEQDMSQHEAFSDVMKHRQKKKSFMMGVALIAAVIFAYLIFPQPPVDTTSETAIAQVTQNVTLNTSVPSLDLTTKLSQEQTSLDPAVIKQTPVKSDSRRNTKRALLAKNRKGNTRRAAKTRRTRVKTNRQTTKNSHSGIKLDIDNLGTMH